MSPGEPVGDALRIRGFYCPRFIHGWGTRAFIVDVRDKLGDDQINDLLESVGHPRTGLTSYICSDVAGLLTRHADALTHGRFNLTVLWAVLNVTRQTAVPFFLESNWKGPHWDIRDALGDHGVTEVLNMMINTWLCSYHPEGPFVPWHYPQQRYNVAVLTRVFNVTR